MNATQEFALLANATSLPWADVPEFSAAELVPATADKLARGGRLCAWFGVPADPVRRDSAPAFAWWPLSRSTPTTRSPRRGAPR